MQSMNILIVEDDTMLRNWLSMLLSNLQNYQLQIHEACDGIEALAVCGETPIDLVITDIKMPRMDGLQLIQKLKDAYPDIRTALLSSYDDFSFVKVAIQCGALDYILKAEMTIKDLSQLLDKVQNDFQMEHILSKGIFPDYSAILNAQQAMTNFLASDTSTDTLLEQLSLPPDPPALAILFLHLQDQRDVDIPIFEAADICEKTLSSESLSGVAIPYRGENCVLLYACSDSAAEFQQMEAIKFTSLVENNFQKYLNLPINFGFHMFCRRGDSLRTCINEVFKAAGYRQYYGSDTKCVDTFPAFPAWKEKIQKALNSNQLESAAGDLKSFLSDAHTARLSPELLRADLLVLLNLFMAFHDRTQARSIPCQPLHTELNDITHAETRETVESSVNAFLRAFSLALNRKKMNLSPAVYNALAYVDENYAGKISLDGVAEHIFMNRSYFCQLFKKEVGMTFGEYLEYVRIENAKRLLSETNLSILSIAEQSGFNNQAYFTRVFKKATDITPMYYRKIHFNR